MKHFLILLIVVLGIASCKTTQKSKSMENTTVAVDNSMKANLIDGNWEANYMANTPKPFAELFAGKAPTITINSVTGQMNGMAGCNNFNGKIAIDGNQLKIADEIALTRKMCPDMAGENVFIETLKKVNTYSVTEQGKTLNLIMGDMAVMRLTRK